MRCCFVLLILFIALLTGFIECGGRGGSKSSSRSGNRYRVVSKGSRSFWKHRSFKPKISSSRSRILFPTLGALAGIYIAHRMRPRVHLSSYDDFDRVTVCPGFRTVIDPATGFEKNYSYFVCPDDPDELWNTYCCLEDTSSQGFCCQSNRYSSWSRTKAISYGSSFATFAAVIIAAVAVYCCCCRGRFRSKRSSNNEDCVLVDEHLTLNPNLPYPTEPPMLSYPTPLGVPSSGGAPINPQPIPTIPPSAPSPALGSAWTSGPSAPPDRRPPMDIPPPPYPGTDPAPPYAVEQSTPYPPHPKV